MSSNQVQGLVTLLNSAKPAEIVDLPVVKDKFIDLYNNIHGSDKGALIYHKEQFNFKKLLAENAALRECSAISLYGCFLDINVNGHSLEQGSKPDCYIIARNFNVGTAQNKVWEKRATLQVSPYGELKLRMRAGQIKYADNPVIVYKGDTFYQKLEDGKKVLVYEENPAHTSEIIGSFLRIVRPDGSVDYQKYTLEDINRWKAASAKQNGGNANALYTSNNGQIDAGFLAAKTIKHAFAAYPKVQTGKFTELPADIETAVTPGAIDYGIDPNKHSGIAVHDIEHTDVTNDAKAAFDEALNTSDNEPAVIVQAGDDEPQF